MSELKPHDVALNVLSKRVEQLRYQIKARKDDIAQMNERLAFAHEQVASAEMEAAAIEEFIASAPVKEA